MLRLILLLDAVCLTLVYSQVSYMTDELLNTNLEPIDRKDGLLKGWEGRAIDSHQATMEKFPDIAIGAQNMLNKLKTLVNHSAPYHINMAKKNQDYFQRVHDAMIVHAERVLWTSGDREKQRTRQCFAIVNTMLNSRLDIQRYYKVRYMYAWTLHFEIGYLSHEILRHYTIVIDLFHLVSTRYVNQTLENHTPARYMLYMYSIILQECKMIIKLCHMIRELEKKYANFEDRTQLWRDTPGSAEQLINAQNKEREANKKAMDFYNSQLDKVRADKMRALKKKQRQLDRSFKESLGVSSKAYFLTSMVGLLKIFLEL